MIMMIASRILLRTARAKAPNIDVATTIASTHALCVSFSPAKYEKCESAGRERETF